MRWVITATRAPAAPKAVAIPTPTFRCERICGRCMILGARIANRTPRLTLTANCALTRGIRAPGCGLILSRLLATDWSVTAGAFVGTRRVAVSYGCP